MAKATPMEYLGGLKFQAHEYDLASIPTNERAAADAASMMKYIRMSAVLLRESDAELEAKVRASDGLDDWADLLDGIGGALAAKKQDVEILNAGFTRLLVVLERVTGEKEINAAYSKPPKASR